MNRRTLAATAFADALALALTVLLAGCSSSGTVSDVSSALTTATVEDPTPLQTDVDYTQLADFSVYDTWVCDNDTIRDPGTGAVLTPSVSIEEAPGILTRTITSNSIPDHLVGDFPNFSNPNTIDEFPVSYQITMRVDAE
ncbi:MAG: hypothetical protein AAGD86_09065, partial [Pseudomonadota bacterium]